MSKKVVVRIVVDTNIIVPSLFSNLRIFQYVLKGNLALVWNNFIYTEAIEICERLWNKVYSHKVGSIRLEDAYTLLYSVCLEDNKAPEMPSAWPAVSRDRDDDPYLWAAEKGNAEYIITMDRKHMLDLGSYNGIHIGGPIAFFNWVKVAYPMKEAK